MSWRDWRGAGVATRASQQPAWRQYLDRLPRQTGSGFEPGSEEDVYARALTSYENRMAEASALGMPDTGEAAPGSVQVAIRGLDLGRAALFNALREFGERGGPDLQRFRERVDDREGFGDLSALQMQDGDGWLTRGAKGAAAFAGDVVTDPLTYVTFGGAAVGKRIGSEIIEAGVRTQAGRMSDDVIRRFAERSAPHRAVDAVRRTQGDEAAEALAQSTLRPPRTFAGSEDEWLRLLGERELAGQAAQAYVGGGTTGLRRWLRDELGEEAGDRMFRSLPRDVQGGLNIRMPFVREGVEGGRAPITYGVGGGGELLERMGLDTLALRGTRARNELRASRLGQWVSRSLAGQDGRLYGQVVHDLVRNQGDRIGGHTYAMYAAVREARRQAGQAAANVHHATTETIASADRLLKESGDQRAARKAFERFFNDPAEAQRLSAAMELDPVSARPSASAWVEGAPVAREFADLTPDERMGLAAARLVQDYLAQMHRQLRAEGVDIGHLEEYIPLILAEEARAARSLARPVKASKGQRGGMSGYNPTKAAQQFWMPDQIAEDGTFSAWRRMTPREVNEAQTAREAAGEATREGDRYITDPLQVALNYGDAARKLVTRVKFANLLRESGATFQGGTDTVSTIVASRVRDAHRAVVGADDAWRRLLAEAPGARRADLTAEDRLRIGRWKDQGGVGHEPEFYDDIASVVNRAGAPAPALFRGMSFPEEGAPEVLPGFTDLFERQRPGGVVNLQPSSFSSSRGAAEGFGADRIVEVRPGAKAVNIPDETVGAAQSPLGRGEAEYLTHGRFRVLEDDGTRIVLEPLAPVPSIPQAAAQAPAEASSKLREAFDAVFDDVPEQARGAVWARLFAGRDRIVIPEGAVEQRIRRVLDRAGWRPDGQEGGRPAFRAPVDQMRERRATLPPVPEGHVRLWRGASDDLIELTAEAGETAAAQRGRYFTPDRQLAQQFADQNGGVLRYVDVPEDVARAHGPDGEAWAALKQLTEGTEEVILPQEWAARAVPANGADPLTAQIDELATQRAALDRSVAALMELPPAQQLQGIEDLMDGLIDFAARAHSDTLQAARRAQAGVDPNSKAGRDLSDLWDARLAESEARLAQARQAAREAVATSSVLDEGSATLAGQEGLRQIGLRHAAIRSADNVNLPPEADVTFAPEMLAQTVERYYKATRAESPELARFLDAVYRPYLAFFKATATVGRGYGYDARNIMGGIWNNWIAGVTANDHKLAQRLAWAVHRAEQDVLKEEAARIAAARGIDAREARRLVDGVQVERLVDERLARQLSGVKVADGVNLYDVHKLMQEQQVSMYNRLQEGMSDAVGRDNIQAWTRGEAPVNLFRHKDVDELNVAQRGLNAFMSQGPTGRWLRHKGDVAEASERFIRSAAFIRGLRQYGHEDRGQMASLLSKALHFDYDDLSDFERVWMRGFALPFYTWTRNNVPLQARALMSNPGLFARAGHFQGALESVLAADEEGGIVPEWMQLRMGFVSRLAPQGNPIAIGMEISAIDLNRWLRIGRPRGMLTGARNELINSLSPVIKAPIEGMLGIDTFTGARHNPQGVEAPSWYRALQLHRLPGMGRVDAQGTVRGRQSIIDFAENSLPPLGLAERHLGGAAGALGLPGGSQRSGERLLTTVLSNWASLPVSTLTPRQQAGELRSRVARLNERMQWSDVPPEALEEARTLLQRGYPPEVVGEWLRRQGHVR